MNCSVKIPPPLRWHTNGKTVVIARGERVDEILRDLTTLYPGLGERLYNGRGEMKGQVHIFINALDIERLQGTRTNVREGDVLTILPARAEW